MPEILKDYCDGNDYKTHSLFSLHANGLQVQLYHDDVELCNPLGSSRTKHKVGMFNVQIVCVTCDKYMYVLCRALLLHPWKPTS